MKIRAKNTIDMFTLNFYDPMDMHTFVLSNHKSFYGCIHNVLNKKKKETYKK